MPEVVTRNRPRIPIGPGTRVKLQFALFLASGELVDSTGQNSASFKVGDGSLLPGFEQAIYGLYAGDSRTLFIEQDCGFGTPNADNIQLLPKKSFAPEIKLAPGLLVSFADQQKTELPGMIRAVKGDRVEVDFNHPLAGKALLFEVNILAVEQVSDEIVRA